MASIRITQFGGLVPDLSSRIKPETHASIAHNCVLDNGTLRPAAKWVRQGVYTAGVEPVIRSIAYNPNSDRADFYNSHDVVVSPGEPFPADTAYGASMTPPVSRYGVGQGLLANNVAVHNIGLSGTVLWVPGLLSTKPINHVYAASRVRIVNGRREEGGLCTLISDPLAVIYEGDVATISISIAALDDGITHVRLYRTISGMDTGSEVQNQLDTEWHLVDEIPILGSAIVGYVDGGSITTDPMDVHFAQQFHPPELVARYFGLTEGGWFVAASQGGVVHVSERYMPHAWPSENIVELHDEITDIAVFSDNIYVGTTGSPFIIAVAQGERGVQLDVVRYEEQYPCLPGTMTATAAGAVYASNAGLIALGREGLQVVTAGLVNPGNKFYTRRIAAEDSPNEEPQTLFAGIPYTNQGAYLRGNYYGFCGGIRSDYFYLSSAPYPYYYQEGLNTAGAVQEVFLHLIQIQYTSPPESLVTTGSVIEVFLKDTFQEYSYGPESLNTTGSLLEVFLRDILVTYSYGPESLDVTGALVSIELDEILITYSNYPPENLAVTGQVVQVELT